MPFSIVLFCSPLLSILNKWYRRIMTWKEVSEVIRSDLPQLSSLNIRWIAPRKSLKASVNF
jgi:hypothetical protein